MENFKNYASDNEGYGESEERTNQYNDRQANSTTIQPLLSRQCDKQITTTGETDTTISKGEEEMNERKTEAIVRKILEQNKKLFPNSKIEEQKSDDARINKLLKNASKSGNGCGKPEFIVSFDNYPNLIIVVECKPDINRHKSKTEKLDNYKDFAVDGVLLYSAFLSKEFDVIAIAVSGENTRSLKIDTFFQMKNNEYKDLKLDKILDFESYIRLYKKDPIKEKISEEELIKYSKELNNTLRDEFELEEGQRPLLVSGILIALEDDAFSKSYLIENTAHDLAESLTNTIKKVLTHHNVEQRRKEDMINIYSFIETNNNIAEDLNKQRNTKLRDLITDVKDKVQTFIKDYKHNDILGKFYSEFLRYANGDRGLGIVLTPKHVTELFAEITQVNKSSVVIDNCCGTGGFLISSMRQMIEDAKGDIKKIQQIHNSQLIGIENNGKMFCLACSNMLLRGDGKSNILYNDTTKIDKTQVKRLKPTIALLNPPYSKKKEGSKELDFILHALEFLEKNGLCVAIVPMRCAIKNSHLKDELLKKHALEAVMSMPNELFSPINTVTCVMVFRANVPHDSNTQTWFGYWKDDGFIKIKNEGRVDKDNKWVAIKKIWLDDFKNRREIPGRCVRHKVKSTDEWCAEAYMETDYSDLKEEDFEKEIKKYLLFKELDN